MAEAPRSEAPRVDPQTARQPKSRYQDRPEIGEIFTDSIRSCVFDGQLTRIEFTVARFDNMGAPGVAENVRLGEARRN